MSFLSTGTATQWIKADDFVQTEFTVTLHNNTTGYHLPTNEKIEITEFSNNGILINIPHTAAAHGHHLILHIKQNRKKEHYTFPPQKNHEVSVTGKVVELEALDPKHNSARIQFLQFNEEDWKKLLDDYLKRQKQVDRLVKKIQE